MPALDQQTIFCPYCGEAISILVDPTEAGSNYIEDCQVCCRPIEFYITEGFGGEVEVQVGTDTE